MDFKAVYVYENNTLSVLVFKNVRNVAVLVHEQEVSKFKIDHLSSSKTSKEIKDAIEGSFKEVEKEFSLPRDIALFFSPESYFVVPEKFTKEFEETTMINVADVERMRKQGIKEMREQIGENWQLVDFVSEVLFVDELEVKKLEGRVATVFSMLGNAVVVDRRTIDLLKDLFKGLNFELDMVHVVEYPLRKLLVENGDLIVSIERTKIRFLSLNNGKIANFDFSVGTVDLLGKVYEVLEQSIGSEQAEEVTRLIQKTWILKKYSYPYDIIEGVDIEFVMDVVEDVLYQYFKFVFSELKKRKIYVDNIKVFSEEIDEKEFVGFLDRKFGFKAQGAVKHRAFASEIMGSKSDFVISNIEIFEGEV